MIPEVTASAAEVVLREGDPSTSSGRTRGDEKQRHSIGPVRLEPAVPFVVNLLSRSW